MEVSVGSNVPRLANLADDDSCKYRSDWSGNAEMATKYATLVTNKQPWKNLENVQL